MNTPITSKQQFKALWNQGLLGNKAGSWDTIEEFERSGFNHDVAISYCGPGSGGQFVANVPARSVRDRLKLLLSADGSKRPSDFRILEQFSPTKIRYVINGEATVILGGTALRYSLVNMMMREAISSYSRQAYSIAAHLILRNFLQPEDFDELMSLLDRYPDHVIEFSGFNRDVGETPGRRMIVWEVRYY